MPYMRIIASGVIKSIRGAGVNVINQQIAWLEFKACYRNILKQQKNDLDERLNACLV